jgi:osmotically inducible protein OsmC
VTQLEKVPYTAKTRTSGGRDGAFRSDDGRLEVKLSTPGTSGALPADAAIDAEVDLRLRDGVFGLAARLHISLPGMDRAAAQSLADGAYQTCRYSRATRGNIDVVINVVTSN